MVWDYDTCTDRLQRVPICETIFELVCFHFFQHTIVGKYFGCLANCLKILRLWYKVEK